MRVIQVTTWATPCGIAGYADGLHRALTAAGITSEIAAIDRDEIRYLARNELNAYFAALAERVADADVVHIQHDFAFFAGAFDRGVSIVVFRAFVRRVLAMGKVVVVTFHTLPVFEPGRRGHLEEAGRVLALKALWRAAVGSLFADRRLHAFVHTRGSRLALVRSGVPARSISIVPQGTPPPIAPSGKGPAEIREALGLPVAATLLSMFGFTSAYKGYATALAAMRSLPDDHHLVIAGGPHPFSADGTLQHILQTVRGRRSLSRRVHITGYLPRDQVQDLHRVTDVCLAPYDATPVLSSSAALTWALASGKPVIASKIPAFVELDNEAHCLLLVSPGSPDELAFRILEVQRDPELRDRLVANALLYCESHQWDRTAEVHIALYERALGAPAGTMRLAGHNGTHSAARWTSPEAAAAAAPETSRNATASPSGVLASSATSRESAPAAGSTTARTR